MRAPEFWYARKPGMMGRALPWLLSPLALLYTAAGWLRHFFVTPKQVSVPVICIGNLVAGGSGKTPIAIALAKQLRGQGRQAHILTRGYGGRLQGPVAVVPGQHTSLDVGDEALLLADAAPTWVAHDRVAGALAAIGAGADLLILDDGMQNPHLVKDFSVILMDGKRGLGNGWVMPSGPLRELRTNGLLRADAVLLVDAPEASEACDLVSFDTALPKFIVTRKPVVKQGELEGQRLYAFCGLGNPQQFFDMLRSLNADLAGARAFADHHPYSIADCRQLTADAAVRGAQLVTTAKDYVRLPEDFRGQVRVVPLEMRFADMAGFMQFLHERMVERGAPRK